jgi:hypothetical protein
VKRGGLAEFDGGYDAYVAAAGEDHLQVAGSARRR